MLQQANASVAANEQRQRCVSAHGQGSSECYCLHTAQKQRVRDGRSISLTIGPMAHDSSNGFLCPVGGCTSFGLINSLHPQPHRFLLRYCIRWRFRRLTRLLWGRKIRKRLCSPALIFRQDVPCL